MVCPLLLRADNVTPPTRTPWGGRIIRDHYKADLGVPGDAIIGESWEVSVEPSFPSRAVSGELLSDAIAAAPEAWMGFASGCFDQLPLLVKLLDAADNLSVQVHPADGDEALGPDESGKPEAWLVLAAAAGAGLYLGFRDGVDAARVARCLHEGGRLDALMIFVPVEPGDAFVIPAGAVHAIGRGVTLVEPQWVRPGKRGITYRFWDWNRRYDAAGKRDANGTPRPLHRERSMAVTDWDGPRGDASVTSWRSQPQSIVTGSALRQRVIDWHWFVVESWRGSGVLSVEPCDTLWAVTCVAGVAVIRGATGDLELRRGQSGVVPAVAAGLQVELAQDAHLVATRCRRESAAASS